MQYSCHNPLVAGKLVICCLWTYRIAGYFGGQQSWRIGLKILLANFNLANTCAPHATPLRTIMHAITHRARACVFGGINFGDLLKNSPIHQIKIPTKFPAVRYAHLRCHQKPTLKHTAQVAW